MRNPGGHAVWTGPAGIIRECDTFTCCHCNGVVFVERGNPVADQGGFCTKCMKNTCGPCADAGTCRPFEKWVDQMEKTITRTVENERELAKICGGG